MLLEFTEYGCLPSGDYEMTFREIRESILIQGDGFSDEWDVKRRTTLLKACEFLVEMLWEVGVTEIYLDGSFVTDKSAPNDIDGYWVAPPKQLLSLLKRLNRLDPRKTWFEKNPMKMYETYRCELYPVTDTTPSALAGMTAPQFFRCDKEMYLSTGVYHEKGIIKVKRG